jgi:hypothetical protein
MSILTTTTARTMMYIFSIGGLLVVNGAAVAYLWNSLMDGRGGEQLRFLEGVGITAFAYVIVFAIKYGSVARPLTKQRQMADTSVEGKCAAMTPEQRGELRKHLAATCGRAESEVKSSTFVHEHHI